MKKKKNLCADGRICLIKLFLTTILLYFLSLYRAPKEIISTIIALQRNSLWGVKEEGRKISCVSLESFCKAMEHGGIGIKNVEHLNFVIVGKWF